MLNHPRRSRRKLTLSARRFKAFIQHPLFWLLTATGNLMILAGAVLMYFFESFGDVHPGFIDCLMWSTSIVTTIGFISWVPVTLVGKITAIGLMFFGTFFVWSYMAFLLAILINPTLSALEKDFADVERELTELKIDEPKPKKHEG